MAFFFISTSGDFQGTPESDWFEILPTNEPVYARITIDGDAGDDFLIFDYPDLERQSQLWLIDSLIASGDGGRIRARYPEDRGVDVTWTSIERLGISGASLATTDSLVSGDSDDEIALFPTAAATALRLFTNGGNDFVSISRGFTSAIVFAGDGDDRVEFGSVFASVANPDSYRIYGGAGNDILRGTPIPGAVDFLYGEAGDDQLIGQAGDDLLDGGDGADLILGGEGNDDLRGGDGDDRLLGGFGDDLLNGGSGVDRMEGNQGNDLYFVDSSRDVVVELSGQGIDTVRSTSNFTLPDHVENLILAGPGFNGIGNGLANEITGNSAANILNGKGGDDFLRGGGGDDVLTGEFGADRLEGGGGSDTFVYRATGHSTAAAPDRILDFTVAVDKIDVSGIDAVKGTAEDDSFTFIGAAAFSGTAGELRAFRADGGWVVQADNDGNGIADLVILVTTVNSTPISAADFVL